VLYSVLKDLFYNFRWLDAVDILLVSYLVYKILLMIKGTRVLQVLTGLVVFAILYFVSMSLQLITVYEIMNRVLNYSFIIIIIIFQDDIRKMLARLGKASFFSISMDRAESGHAIEEIVKACMNLARKSIGALIVIEQNMSLTESIEIGVKLNAEISSDLIVSIFSPSAPVHDGAIVITGTNISAAGCFLPLTRNPNVDKSLGTRHRAAIGLTENTDALVIVVSEELREVSVAKDGQLSRNLDSPTLRKTLANLYGIKEAVYAKS
jgi:diadenylate cyclase